MVCLQTMRRVDWHSRKVLSWRLSNSMDAEFCIGALKEPLAKHGTPEVFNTDQGSQFTSGCWIDVRTDAKIKISMDGKGARRDNRMIERLWRSLKSECFICTRSKEAQRQRLASEIGWPITMPNSRIRRTAY